MAVVEVVAGVARGFQRVQQRELALLGEVVGVLRVAGGDLLAQRRIEAGLQRLQATGLPMACLTNKPLAFAQALLEIKGLDGFFSQVFGGDSFERKKPDPLPLLRTCEALGCLPARTLMVGDSSNDAQAARAAGCPVVLVTYGYNHGRPIAEENPARVLDNLRELLPAAALGG